MRRPSRASPAQAALAALARDGWLRAPRRSLTWAAQTHSSAAVSSSLLGRGGTSGRERCLLDPGTARSAEENAASASRPVQSSPASAFRRKRAMELLSSGRGAALFQHAELDPVRRAIRAAWIESNDWMFVGG